MSSSLGLATDGIYGGGSGGAIIYRMRAKDLGLGRYVFWSVETTIDALGAQYTGPGPLVDIVVQQIIGG